MPVKPKIIGPDPPVWTSVRRSPGSKLVGNFLGDGRATAGKELQLDAVTLLKNLLQAFPQFGARWY